MKAGRGYVSEGRAHLINLRVSARQQRVEMGGEDLALAAPPAIRLEAIFTARLEPAPTPATEAVGNRGPLDKPYWHLKRARLGHSRKVMVELIVNGLPVESRPMIADGKPYDIAFAYTPTRSCWVALRIMHGAHTNPVWVIIAGAPVRVARSIAWRRAAVDQCWRQKKFRIRLAELAAEAARYDEARAAYDVRAKDVAL